MSEQDAISALERALRDALGSLPRDQVLRCVEAALPARVLNDADCAPELLGELIAELEAEFGAVPDSVRAQTRLEWPDALI